MKVDINRVKISVTVPVDNVVEVRNAMCEAGAGIIGNYDYCSNSCRVIGTYLYEEPGIDIIPLLDEEDLRR